MMHLLILNDPPYGPEHSYNRLRLAHTLIKHDLDGVVSVFLMADAVGCAQKGQKTPDGYYNIERMLRRVLTANGRVLICGTCTDARGMAPDDVIDWATRSSMDELGAATIAADRVLVF